MLRPVYEPMVVHPRDWTNPFNGGYLSSNIKLPGMVKTKNRAYLEELTHTSMPIVYDALNVTEKRWRGDQQGGKSGYVNLLEKGSELGGLPPRDELPLPAKPADIEENEQVRKKYRVEAARVHLQNLQITGHRIGFNIALDIAKRYEGFRKIYSRTNLTSVGASMRFPTWNPQGSDVQKALLRFPLMASRWVLRVGSGSLSTALTLLATTRYPEDRVNYAY